MWRDVGPSRIIGTLNNGAAYSSANLGSIIFDATNDSVSTPTQTISLTAGGTMEMWVRLNAVGSAQGFFSFNSGGGSYINFYMATNTMRWEVIGTTGSAYTTINCTTVFTTGVWYHVLGTFNGTTTVIYINGVSENSQTMTNQPTSMTGPFIIGTYAGYCAANIALARFYNRALSATEVLQNYYAGRNRMVMDGSSPLHPAISAAAIKAVNPDVQSGVYWLHSNGINSGTPFQCYCDFTMDGGIGYAIYFQQYFDSTDDGGSAGYEYGPTFAAMSSSGVTGTTGYGNEFNVYPNLMPTQYNNGAGASRMIVFNRSNSGTSAGGIQGATNYKWTRISGITAANMRDIWKATPTQAQYTVSFVSAGNAGRNSGSGTGYILGAHEPTNGPHQWVANASSNVNDYLIFEYKPFANVNDPNHYWMVETGVAGATYFRANAEYGASGVFQLRYGGIAIY